MSNQVDTDTIRAAAPEWSLDGDRKLLDLLQNIHQKITSKCQETNSKLDEMVTALDNASVTLQNVNNRFMALSNTQFVESRVYDDDTYVASEPKILKKPQENNKNPQDSLLHSLEVLENMHEPVDIFNDSDSDSDDDRDSIVILKPKDLYEERPLPYIIGSYNWKNKWHAGLILEDSDTESSTSRHLTDQYSESESENEVQLDSQPEPIYNVAESTPQPRVDSEESLYKPHMPKIYKPHPAAATLFPEEPPPIDNQDSDWDPIPSSESEDDIRVFAEINRNTPYVDTNKGENIGDSKTEQKSTVPTTQKSIFLQEKDEVSNDNTKTSSEAAERVLQEKMNIKKPIGAISLFGSTKGSESIGAAILKRNQRRSSSDESEDIGNNSPEQGLFRNSGQWNIQREETVSSENVKTNEKPKESSNAFDELFAKAQSKNKVETKKVDIFSDIFDDIDDIFTTDVKKESKAKTSLFDDDLFSDVKTDRQMVLKDDLFEEPPPLTDDKELKTESDSKNISKPKSIFDDDDEILFNESSKNTKETTEPKIYDQSKMTQQKSKSIFDSDSDDSDIFAKIKPKSAQTGEIKPATHSNKVTVDKNEKGITNIFTQSENTAESDTVPQTSKIENNDTDKDIENKTSDMTAPSNKEIVQNTQQELSIDKHADIFKDKSSDVDWDTDLPLINDENKVPKYEAPEKPKILTKPNILAKPSLEMDPSKPVENITSNVQNRQQITQEHNPSGKIENASVFEDIFQDEPPIIQETINTQEESKQNAEDVVEGEILKIQKEEKQISGQTDKVFDTSDIFEDMFINQPSPTHKIDSSDIFSDIPPPIEVKAKDTKNANINALFGDDSDDESLFFKTEPAMDDVPPKNDALETIFHDEPPDFDFTSEVVPKLKKIGNKTVDFGNEINNAVISTNQDKAVDEPDQSEAKKFDSSNKITDRSDKSNQLDTTDANKPIGKLKPMTLNINVNTLLPGASPKKTITKPATPVKSETDVPKMVNSPVEVSNMVKSVSFDSDPDSLILDNKISKERAKIQIKRRPSSRRARQEAVRKSGIDFVDATGDINAEDKNIKDSSEKTDLNQQKDVTDTKNKLYTENVSEKFKTKLIKQKIPDLNQDEGKKNDLKQVMIKQDVFNETNKAESLIESDQDSTKILNINSEDVYIFKEPKVFDSDESVVESNEKGQIVKEEFLEPKKNILSIFDDVDTDDIFGENKNNQESKSEAKSKKIEDVANKSLEEIRKPAKSGRRLVLADDDDDLFTAGNIQQKLKSDPTSSKITTDNEDIFKTMSKTTKDNFKSFLDEEDDLFDFTKTSETSTKTDGVKTLGKEYQTESKSKTTITVENAGNTKGSKGSKLESLFDDLSDEELFGGKTSKSKMPDRGYANDSDEELFSKKVSKKSVTQVKATLFEDADDDGLFASKKIEKDTKSQPSSKTSQPEKTSKPQEVVFDDPLSMFNED